MKEDVVPATVGGPSVHVWWTALTAIGIASFATCLALDVYFFGDATISEDEDRFLKSAAELLAQGQFRVNADVAFEMPGTALLFAAVTALQSGSQLMAVRVANAALVGAQSVLLGLLAARIFNDRLAGLIAAAIGGFYPYVLFTQGMALSETPFTFLLVGGFLALYVWRDRGAQIDASLVLVVVLFTAATYTKATLTIMPPVLIGLAAVGHHRLSGVLRVGVVAAVLYCGFMAPWWVRNYALLGEFVPFTTSASRNLYMGNSPHNPNADTYGPVQPADWSLDHGVLLEGIPGELDRDRAFRNAALRYIVEDPAAFFRRATIKLGVFWSLIPNAPAFQKPLYRIVGLASFGPVLALAILCLIQLRRRFLDLLPIYTTIGYFTAIHTVTIASIRYRLPIEPLLIVLAAWPSATLLRFVLKTPPPQSEPA